MCSVEGSWVPVLLDCGLFAAAFAFVGRISPFAAQGLGFAGVKVAWAGVHS